MGESMNKFDHLVVRTPHDLSDEKFTEFLDGFGEDGWNLVSLGLNRCVFVRELTPAVIEHERKKLADMKQEAFYLHLFLDHDYRFHFIGDAQEVHDRHYPECPAATA